MRVSWVGEDGGMMSGGGQGYDEKCRYDGEGVRM